MHGVEANEASINYLEAARHSKLKLVQGDSVELLDIIQTIDAYEGGRLLNLESTSYDINTRQVFSIPMRL